MTNLTILFLFLTLPGISRGVSQLPPDSARPDKEDSKPRPEKRDNTRKGLYLLKEILEIRDKKNDLSFYRIIFNKRTGGEEAAGGEPQQPAEPVWLNTYHVHAGLIRGTTYEIQAYGIPGGDYFEAMQVLVFLHRKHGKSPVWMISKDKKGIDLRGSSFLKMHSPASDYVIF